MLGVEHSIMTRELQPPSLRRRQFLMDVELNLDGWQALGKPTLARELLIFLGVWILG